MTPPSTKQLNVQGMNRSVLELPALSVAAPNTHCNNARCWKHLHPHTGKLSEQEKNFDSSQHPTIFLLLCFWQAITLFSELQLNVWLGRDYF